MTIDRVQAWLERYLELWRAPDRAAVGELFSEDVVYRHGAAAQPIVSRAALVDHWLADPDPAGSWQADWRAEMVDGEMAAASGTTTYNALARPGYEGEYSNVLLLRFDADGRCADYREWWMPLRRRSSGA